MKTVEYRVRPVTRYIVTEHVDNGSTGGSFVLGEFQNMGQAERVAARCARAESVEVYTPEHQTHRIIHHDGRVYDFVDCKWVENVDVARRVPSGPIQPGSEQNFTREGYARQRDFMAEAERQRFSSSDFRLGMDVARRDDQNVLRRNGAVLGDPSLAKTLKDGLA